MFFPPSPTPAPKINKKVLSNKKEIHSYPSQKDKPDKTQKINWKKLIGRVGCLHNDGNFVIYTCLSPWKKNPRAKGPDFMVMQEQKNDLIISANLFSYFRIAKKHVQVIHPSRKK